MAGPPALELRGIDKWFGAVHANSAIDLIVQRGRIHGIIGENGAGKSTLMSILYGFYQADSGAMLIDGRPVAIADSSDAIRHRIAMVHQHFMLVETLSVLENVVLGMEGGPLLRRGRKHARAELLRIEREYRMQVDPDAIVGHLPVGAQQRVEILKALYRGAEILILDEPTAVLTPAEADHLFRVLAALRREGKTVLLITHKLREIMACTDDVSVMRSGRMIAHRRTAATTPEELGELMIGRRLAQHGAKSDVAVGENRLSVEGLRLRDTDGVERLKDVSFNVRSGEIVGIAGVAGNGQSELLEVLAGMRPATGGTIRLGNEQVFPGPEHTPDALRLRKLAHVPEDRLRLGLVRTLPAWESMMLGYQDDPAYQRFLLIDRPRVQRQTGEAMRAYDVRPPQPRLRSANFSGGNQQKLILARELERDPDILLVGQPTRGVDIGGIAFIHDRLLAMRAAGKAILLVSVEIDEIMRLSDRILVMFDGRIAGTMPAALASERTLGAMMAGHAPEPAGPASR